MNKETVRVGLLGAGTIGAGVVSLFKSNGPEINAKTAVNLVLEKVADRDSARLQALGLEKEKLIGDASGIIDDPAIDIVIELIGGLEPARTFIARALENGKYVVTANKDLMATHGRELLDLALARKRHIFYEASVGGGIPLVRPLKFSLVADRIRRVIGIVNGTTNYIFTRMDSDDLSLQEALDEARRLGFAEADPTNDIEGLDAAYKLIILAGLAFGKKVSLDRVYVQGIGSVAYEDIVYAREIGCVIKLLAIGEDLPGGLALRVHPALVPIEHPLASVMNELNAVFMQGDAVGDIMFYGPGAGSMPTATAVVADVAEAARLIGREPDYGMYEKTFGEAPALPMGSLDYSFYMRLLADNRPGVFASLGNAFASEQVSLDMVIQKRCVGELAEIVLVTQLVREEAFQKALKRVLAIPAIKPDPSVIRLLG